MEKPVTMCEELGCTRPWTRLVKQYGQPLMAPVESTAMTSKLCAPCADKMESQETAGDKTV
jgi:hypothetical protein